MENAIIKKIDELVNLRFKNVSNEYIYRKHNDFIQSGINQFGKYNFIDILNSITFSYGMPSKNQRRAKMISYIIKTIEQNY